MELLLWTHLSGTNYYSSVPRSILPVLAYVSTETQRQARKNSQAGKKRVKGREENTQREARKESKAGKEILILRQEKT